MGMFYLLSLFILPNHACPSPIPPTFAGYSLELVLESLYGTERHALMQSGSETSRSKSTHT